MNSSAINSCCCLHKGAAISFVLHQLKDGDLICIHNIFASDPYIHQVYPCLAALARLSSVISHCLENVHLITELFPRLSSGPNLPHYHTKGVNINGRPISTSDFIISGAIHRGVPTKPLRFETVTQFAARIASFELFFVSCVVLIRFLFFMKIFERPKSASLARCVTVLSLRVASSFCTIFSSRMFGDFRS